ncbi:hypothetical protein V7S43_015115 [Phytophthora oleae]|uniref:FYVE-type domain-containing protein n=1 Tax=Phytophthora oleae TaxID=2107226 RepID=A0ABD3EZD0_9STRA
MAKPPRTHVKNDQIPVAELRRTEELKQGERLLHRESVSRPADSEGERTQLIELVNGIVTDYFQKYEDFVTLDKRQVDEQRWKHFKTKDSLHVYSQRSQKKIVTESTGNNGALPMKDLPLAVKASYVHDLDAGSILTPIIEPNEEEPFRSLIIKWMTIDAPLQTVHKSGQRILHLENGDRVGYHLAHSIEFPQTKPRPNVIRANLSYLGFLRQIEQNEIDAFGWSTVAPGGDVMRFISLRVATEALLSANNLVYCGQMKKLSWMLQRQHASNARQSQRNEKCVICSKDPTSGLLRGLEKSTCKLCYGCVCSSCKIRRRISFITLDGKLTQRRISVCSRCISSSTTCSAREAARAQATGFKAYKAFSASSQSDTLSSDEMY